MPRIKITDRGAKAITHNRKPIHNEGDIIDVSLGRARLLVSCLYALPLKGSASKPDSNTSGPSVRDLEVAYRYNALRAASKPEPTAKQIREWANDNDIDVPARGAIPAVVREAYAAAHND